MTKSDGLKNNEQFKVVSFFRLLNTLSIDVVIGSAFSAFLVVKLLNVEPGWSFWIVLPVSVWIIYTMDHLVDAYRLKNTANTHRHCFHYLHLKTMIALVLVLSFLNLFIIVLWLQKEILIFGIILSFVTIAYLLLIYLNGKKQIPFSKEILVSIIYTFGIWGGPFSMTNFLIHTGQILLIVAFFLLVLADVLLLSLYEVHSDKKDNHLTFTVKHGRTITAKLIFALVFSVFGISIFVILSQEAFMYRSIAKLFLIMGLVEIIILSFPHSLKKNDSYRFIIEWVFWIPGLVLLF